MSIKDLKLIVREAVISKYFSIGANKDSKNYIFLKNIIDKVLRSNVACNLVKDLAKKLDGRKIFVAVDNLARTGRKAQHCFLFNYSIYRDGIYMAKDLDMYIVENFAVGEKIPLEVILFHELVHYHIALSVNKEELRSLRTKLSTNPCYPNKVEYLVQKTNPQYNENLFRKEMGYPPRQYNQISFFLLLDILI